MELEKLNKLFGEKNKNLYHYTGSSGLKSIVENNQLWITHREYVNDMYDKDFVKTLLKNKLLKLKDHNHLLFHDTADESEEYVFSLSREGDLSNQWAHYGKNDGYCLVFSESKLDMYFNDLANSLEIGFVSGNVIYKEGQQQAILNSYIEICKNFVKTNPPGKSLSQEGKKFTDKLFEFMLMIRTQFKHRNNHSEQEYRYNMFLSKSDKVKGQEFLVKEGVFTPIFKTPNIKLPIKEIIIGPKVQDPNSVKGLKKFLLSNNYVDVNISLSKSKVRY